MMDNIETFVASKQLSEDLTGSNSLTRSSYHDGWSQALKDDYAGKSMQLNNSTERLNFVSNELLRTQNELIKINERLKLLEGE